MITPVTLAAPVSSDPVSQCPVHMHLYVADINHAQEQTAATFAYRTLVCSIPNFVKTVRVLWRKLYKLMQFGRNYFFGSGNCVRVWTRCENYGLFVLFVIKQWMNSLIWIFLIRCWILLMFCKFDWWFSLKMDDSYFAVFLKIKPLNVHIIIFEITLQMIRLFQK